MTNPLLKLARDNPPLRKSIVPLLRRARWFEQLRKNPVVPIQGLTDAQARSVANLRKDFLSLEEELRAAKSDLYDWTYQSQSKVYLDTLLIDLDRLTGHILKMKQQVRKL